MSETENLEPWQRIPIEPGVAPLVDVMNAHPAIRTIASCHGHIERGTGPYVYFAAPITLASAIERALCADAHGARRLRTPWRVSARFDGAFELRFSLGAPRYDVAAPYSLVLSRRRLDRDLAVLTNIVGDAVRCQQPSTPGATR